jgi:hypothetical protein
VPTGSSPKRERQYEHVKDSEQARGNPRATEIAARTVNKQRARSGETKTSGPGTANRRGGGSGEPTKAQLYDQAKEQNIYGRSSMSKAELQRAVNR